MTLPQALAFSVLGVLLVLFVWDRWRYDLVALLGLLAAVALGVVPPDKAFAGFSDQIVVLVASALVVSAAIARSGIVESWIRPLVPRMQTVSAQVLILVTLVAFLSAFMKNIGALALFLPVAVTIARRTGASPSCLLMPLSFGALLGGLMTLIGTSPNIIVSRIRKDLLGEPFGMFDFAPVGLVLTIVGIAFMAWGYRLLRTTGRGTAGAEMFTVEAYTTEMRLPAESALVDRTVADLEALADHEISVTAIIRDRRNRYVPAAHWTLFAEDILILEGDPKALEAIVREAGLELVGTKGQDPDRGVDEDIGTVEAVITQASPMIGASLRRLRLRERFGINLMAVSRRGDTSVRLRQLRFQAGDVVLLQGRLDGMPEVLSELGCLPLAQRRVELGLGRRRWLPLIIVATAMAAVSTGLVPVALGFLAAAVLMVMTRSLTLKDAYEAVEWPILVLLAALIPVSDAVQTTGGSELIAGWLAGAVKAVPGMVAVGLVMLAAMAITPFLNNAATVLVMAPIAGSLATQLGWRPDPFLMATAIGAGCDFLTPIGHQCNTLVMGPGGYRFGDYWRLGLPLSLIVLLLGTPLILLVWPL